MKAIPITRIGVELPADQAVTAMAMALQELAIAQTLVLIHGPELGAQRYIAAGGHVRFDADGEPVLLWDPA